MNKTLILSLLIGGICGNIATPITIQPVTAAPLPKLERSTAQPAVPATIEILSPGAEPRRELKFKPAANSKQTMVMTMGMSMDMSMAGSPMPQTPIPKMVIKMDLNVQKVDPSGDIHYSFAYGDVKAIAEKNTPPEMLAAMQNSLKSLIGIQGNMVMSSSGLTKSKNLIIPKTADPLIKETLEQFNTSMDRFSTQLPSGLLGVGAKWKVSNAMQSGGIKFNQSATHEIVAVNDSGMTVKTQITQLALPQDLKLPNVGKSAKVKLNSLTSKGEGQYQIRFDSLLPIAGNLSINSDSKMSIQVSPKEPPTNMVNRVGIDLTISEK
jgi:hypothetical protein